VDVADGIATLTIDRPTVKNALDRETVAECHTALETFERDETVGVLIVTGAGESSFVSGADINDIRQRTRRDGLAAISSSLCARVERFARPTIAAINGYALGGGCELALACHVRVASENARLGTPEVKLGIMCGYAGTQRLPRLVGKGRALEMLLTGEMVAAQDALRIGLVNRVVPKESLLAEAEALLRQMLANGPVSLRFTLQAVNAGLEMPLDEAQYLEATLFGLICTTEDMKEGTKAFLEKRPPKFQGK
jgi:enoyl-CoA hydratase